MSERSLSQPTVSERTLSQPTVSERTLSQPTVSERSLSQPTVSSEQLIVLPVHDVYPGRAREASVYVETLTDTLPGCLLDAHLFARDDGTGTVGVLLPELYAEHRVKGGALSVKICVPVEHKQDDTDDLWRLVKGAPTTPVKGMEGVLNSVVFPGCFAPSVDFLVEKAPVAPSGRLDPVVVEPVEKPITKSAAKARRPRSTTVLTQI